MENHKKLYEEALVKEIMISTALCIQEMLVEDPNIGDEDVCQFIEENYGSIIEETLSSDTQEGDDDTESWEPPE
jgi:hypothetical protein